jgi:1-acyl-sn-glycerol-3-phosphate acyltransferase
MSRRKERAPGAVVVDSRPAYLAGRTFLVGYLGLYHRFRAEGVEHLPRTGGALIVSNHQSFLDIPVIAVAARPRHVAFVARASLAQSRFLDWLMRESGCVLIRPNTPDRAALEGMIAHLEQGDCVAVFPEGTRTPDGGLGDFRAGAVIAARRAGVPLVPAAIRGAFEAWPRSRKLPSPGRITVRFGPPLRADGEEPMEAAKAVIAGMLAADGAGRNGADERPASR